MMHKSQTSRINPWLRKLNVEALEDRTVMNGVVTASLNSLGVLQIVGDRVDNQITIAPSPIAGMIRISGDLGTATSINGAAFADFSLAAVKDITVDLREGGDSVTVADFSITGTLTVVYENAADSVSLSNFNSRAAEAVFAGEGITGSNRSPVDLLPGLTNPFNVRNVGNTPGLLGRVPGPGTVLGTGNLGTLPGAPGSGILGSNNNSGLLPGVPK